MVSVLALVLLHLAGAPPGSAPPMDCEDLARRASALEDDSSPGRARAAFFATGQCWQAIGETERANRALERAERAPAPGLPGQGLMGEGDPTFLLARSHEARKEWKAALAAWERWKPTSWCGNAVATLHSRRLQGIARCKWEMGEQTAAFEVLGTSHLFGMNGLDLETVRLWADLAGRTKQPQAELSKLMERLLAASKPPEDASPSMRAASLQYRLPLAAGAFREMGEPAKDWLARRSLDGDEQASLLAAEIGRPTLESFKLQMDQVLVGWSEEMLRAHAGAPLEKAPDGWHYRWWEPDGGDWFYRFEIADGHVSGIHSGYRRRR